MGVIFDRIRSLPPQVRRKFDPMIHLRDSFREVRGNGPGEAGEGGELRVAPGEGG